MDRQVINLLQLTPQLTYYEWKQKAKRLKITVANFILDNYEKKRLKVHLQRFHLNDLEGSYHEISSKTLNFFRLETSRFHCLLSAERYDGESPKCASY